MNITRNTNKRSKYCAQSDGEDTEWFEIKARVRHGCIWSPLVFIILIDYGFTFSLDENKFGMVIDKRINTLDQKLSDLAFADDIAMHDNTEKLDNKSSRRQLTKLHTRGAKAGLVMNVEKSYVIHVKKKPKEAHLNILGSTKLEMLQTSHTLE